MNGKNINFDNKNIKTSHFYKNKTPFHIDDIMLIKYKSLKKNHMANVIRLYTFLDIMIMILLGHYV